MKKRCVAYIMVILMIGCSSQALNDNPPEYIKRVVAYKEGPDGLMIYFILADKSGVMTTSNGEAKIKILETYPGRPWERGNDLEISIYIAEFAVKKEDFEKTRIGVGAFEHEAILFSFGRLPYSAFPLKPKSIYGRVELDFKRPDGKVLKGKAAVNF